MVTGEYPPAIGGVADYTALLGRHLEALGIRVTVITTGRGEAQPPGVETVTAWGLRTLPEVLQRIADAGADVVHLQYQTAAFAMSPLINCLPLLLRGRGIRAPFVTTFHDLREPYLFPKAGVLRRLANHLLIGASEASIFTDPVDLARAHPRRVAAWIPIGPSTRPSGPIGRHAERVRWGIGEDEVAIAFFGFVNRSKAVDVLLRAAERVGRAGVALRILLIGDESGVSDPTNRETALRVRASIAALGLEERVTRTGPLAAEQISAALTAADLVVLPYADGASLRRASLLTCLAHGIPVVSTRPSQTSGVPPRFCIAPFEQPELFRLDDRVLALVPPGDDAALAREIFRLINDPERMATLGRAGAAFASRFDWSDVAAAMAEVYRRVLPRTSRSS